MKFPRKQPLKHGETRIITKFLWWPRTCFTSDSSSLDSYSRKRETRWLEVASWEEKASYTWGKRWVTRKWIDDEI